MKPLIMLVYITSPLVGVHILPSNLISDILNMCLSPNVGH
jgi:hypothetical protein